MEPKQEIIVGSIVFGSVRSDSLREEKASKSSTLPLLKKKNSVKKRKVISQDIQTSFCSDTKKKTRMFEHQGKCRRTKRTKTIRKNIVFVFS